MYTVLLHTQASCLLSVYTGILPTFYSTSLFQFAEHSDCCLQNHSSPLTSTTPLGRATAIQKSTIYKVTFILLHFSGLTATMQQPQVHGHSFIIYHRSYYHVQLCHQFHSIVLSVII